MKKIINEQIQALNEVNVFNLTFEDSHAFKSLSYPNTLHLKASIFVVVRATKIH